MKMRSWLHVALSVATSIEKHLSIPGVNALLQDADDVHSTVDAVHAGLMPTH